MTYMGFGIVKQDSIPRPRKPFRPVFQQLSESGIGNNYSSAITSAKSWFEQKEHLINEEERQHQLTGKIFLAITIATLITIVAVLV